MDKAQIARLKEVAEKANPGGWEMVIGHPRGVITSTVRWPVADVESCNDAAFIAAANPAAILELIAENGRLEKENEELRANNYGPEILNDPAALTVSYFAGRMAEGREKNREIDKVLDENRRLEKENERLKIELHDMDSSGREAMKDFAQLEKEADWLAEYSARDECPLETLGWDKNPEDRPQWCDWHYDVNDNVCGSDCSGGCAECWRKAAQDAIAEEEDRIVENEDARHE